MFAPIFPGMDPFIELQRWTEFHNLLIAQIRYELGRLLIPQYDIRIEEVTPTITEIDDQQRIEIRDDEGRLITVVEVLSPASKGRHRDRYLANRDALLSSDVHLIEIDLLRYGDPMERSNATYLILVARAQPDKAHRGELYEIDLRDVLPVIPVPLKPGDADIPLDIGQVFREVYTSARYRMQLDYTQPPDDLPAWIHELLKAI